MVRIKEIQEEFRALFSNKQGRVLDSILPVAVYLVVYQLADENLAVWGAVITVGILTISRLIQRESLIYSLAGLGGVLLAAVSVKLSGSASGFFLPGLISGAITAALCILTVAINRPLAAWTSAVTRRWPLNWYWHPQVLPAYSQVTTAWAAAFSLRLALEYWLFQQQAIQALGAVKLILGWPYTVLVLIASYVYGMRRLKSLAGPSVEEFKAGKPAPWEGQKRGF